MRAIASFLLPLILAAEPASIQWTENPSRNMTSTATGLPAILAEATKVKELKLGSHQYSVPFVNDGRIYVGTNDWNVGNTGRFKRTRGGLIAALDDETGELIWQLPVPKTELRGEYHFNIFNCGVCSSPTVSGDQIYIIGSRGTVLCLDTKGQADGNDGPFMDELSFFEDAMVNQGTELQADDGDIIWAYDLIEEEHVFPHDVLASTPLLLNGFLYVCTSNGQRGDHKTVANPDAASLIVLDAQTGQLVARDAENIGHRVLHGMWSSPSHGRVNGRDLVFWGGGDGWLYAFKAETASKA